MLAFAVRAAVGIFVAQSGGWSQLTLPDEQQYWQIAESLAAGKGMRDELGFQASRMPLYPGFLSIFARIDHGIVVAKLAQWFIAALGAAVTALLGFAMFDRQKIGLMAGLIVALDPYSAYFSSLLLSETMFGFLLVVLWMQTWPLLVKGARLTARESGCTKFATLDPDSGTVESCRMRGIKIGVVAVLCLYVRDFSAILLGGGLLAYLVFLRPNRRVLAPWAIACATLFLLVLPWGCRNQHVLGEFRLLTTRGGISLFDGVRPDARGDSDLGPSKQMPGAVGLSEVKWDRFFHRESWRLIRENPGRIVRLAWPKFLKTWSLAPSAENLSNKTLRILIGTWTAIVLLLSLAGLLMMASSRGLGPTAALSLLWPAFAVAVTHCIFVGSLRYRLGAMPMLELAAAFALVKTGDLLPFVKRSPNAT